MPLTDGVLPAEGVRAADGGTVLDVHLPWYRSLPASCLEGLTVRLDGAEAEVSVAFGDEWFRVEELAERTDLWWFVQDGLPTRVEVATTPGADVRVELDLAVRIPYIIIGPQTALVTGAHIDGTYTVAERSAA